MKKITSLFLILFFSLSCDNPIDCITSNGEVITKEFDFQNFDVINVNAGVKLVLKQAEDYSVSATIGSNFENDLQISQQGKSLTLTSKSSCNWVRDFGEITVYISAPNITEIYSKSAKDIVSNGILNFETLRLYSFEDNQSSGTSDFKLQLEVQNLVIETNFSSRFYLSGNCNQANFNFYNGDSRIEAADLIIQKLQVYHRGSNDMVVKPMQSITGKMVSTGNIILKNNPPIVAVEQLYQGQVIYN
jgi:predicted 3-demethylubiquinone-9 3-methyltransferase (glyoxalase superfamily)